MKKSTLLLVMTTAFAACAGGEDTSQTDQASQESGRVVDVIARGLTLEAPSEIPSGWTTFRFLNQAPMVHFAVIERMPEGQGIESQQREVAPVFQAGMNLLIEGDLDAALAKFGELPAWFGEIVFLGGPGLTAPARISQATVYLEPGTYLFECYVKTGGVFHSYNPDPSQYGMVHQFTVTEAANGQEEPTATVGLEISSETGISMSGTASAGEQTFRVTFNDQTGHENFVGHDVHLARLTESTNLAELEQWMDWTQPAGLQTPSPVEFLGGLNELPAGGVGYFTATLEPGNYVLISEVPGSQAKGLFLQFTVE